MAVKTLSHFGNFKSIGISTLEVLVYSYPIIEGTICPMLDALRGDIYCAIYPKHGTQYVVDINDCVLPFSDYVALLMKSDYPKPFIFVGNAALMNKNILIEKFGENALFPPSSYHSVSPVKVAELGLKKLHQVIEDVENPITLQPVYLRKPEAESVWDKNHSRS
jgi:tRNA threonylcarbamoyladenosine biosynthesis protein TsaB